MITTQSGWTIQFNDDKSGGRAGPFGKPSVLFTTCKRCRLAHFNDDVPADVAHAVNRECKRFVYLRCNGCGHGIECCACEAGGRA